MNQAPAGFRELVARERELLAMPSITDKLPIKFDSELQVNDFEGFCDQCEGAIPVTRVFGVVSWPTPALAVIEAVGVCRTCRLGTSFLVRMRADGRFSTLMGHRWREGQIPLSWQTQLQRWWRKFWPFRAPSTGDAG